MQAVATIGLDIAKNVFQAHGVDAEGAVRFRKKLSRAKLEAFFAELPPCLVGIEACASAHHWARVIRALGHEVRLMPPAYVKPYVKSQKNDAADAEAICEAVRRPTSFAVLALGIIRPLVLAGHPPFFWWPIAALAGSWVVGITTSPGTRSSKLAQTILMLLIAGFAVMSALGILSTPSWPDAQHVASPGLANLAAFVVGLAILYLLWAFLRPQGRGHTYLARALSDVDARTAFDVFAVLGGAVTIVSFARLFA